jgi:hypothetical protein
MMKKTQGLSAEYGVDFGNIILNSMAGRQNGENAAFDFSALFETLTDAEIEALIALPDNALAEALGLTEEDFENLGYDSAQAFGEAFDKGLFEKEEKALGTLMQYISGFGGKGDSEGDLSNSMFDNIMKQASSSLTADQMNALSSRPLALSQINFASDDLEGIGKQLTYLAESAEKAQKKTTGLTEDQKKLAKELNYSEDALKLYAEELKNNNKGLEDNDEAAVDVALANIRMNKGISELTSN